MLFDAKEDWLFFRHGHGEYVRDALFQLGVPQIAIYRENEVLIHWNEFPLTFSDKPILKKAESQTDAEILSVPIRRILI